MGLASLAKRDHTALSVTGHTCNCVNTPRLTPARRAGIRITYPGGMEGVD